MALMRRPENHGIRHMVKARLNRQFRAHDSDPMMMGRGEASYDALCMYPETINEVLAEFSNT